MSSLELNPTAVWFLWPSGGPRAYEPMVRAIEGAFDELGRQPTRIVVIRKGKEQNARYSLAKALELAADPEHHGMSVLGPVKGPDTKVKIVLRPHSTDRPGETGHGYVVVLGEHLPPEHPGPMAFLTLAAEQYPVAHGGAMLAPGRAAAYAEGGLVGYPQKMTEQAIKRKHFDAMNRHDASKLRRIYPRTIIGPEIWKTLPPLPPDAPPVRDLGTCKVLEAWPTLCDVDDPQFQLGTRALRRWIWPHTIQNPVDDPDEVDRALRWKDLLPWE